MDDSTIHPQSGQRNGANYPGQQCLRDRLYAIWQSPSSTQQSVPSAEELAVMRREKRRHRDKEYVRAKLLDEGYRQTRRTQNRAWRDNNHGHVKERQKAYRAKNKEKMQIIGRRCREKARANPAGRMKRLIYQCLGRSREKGWTADRAFLVQFVERPPLVCECCERDFDFNARGRSLAVPSLDRIDNSKGYVAGNVAVICYECNMIKNSGTLQQHEAIVQYMRRHLTH
ncbi:MAG: hypothetical protein K8U57_36055 [Planctomycetes bacterium]|nr:hypothetical protein [Planctomycetota bacterium]